jgi:hypothetical protein
MNDFYTLAKKTLEDRAKNPPSFAFEIGQVVRIRNTLDNWWDEIDHWRGQEGTVIKRYEAGTLFRGDNTYHIEREGRVEPFKEYELDMRYRRGDKHASKQMSQWKMEGRKRPLYVYEQSKGSQSIPSILSQEKEEEKEQEG